MSQTLTGSGYIDVRASWRPAVLPLFAGDTDFIFYFIKKKKKIKSQYSKGREDFRTPLHKETPTQPNYPT